MRVEENIQSIESDPVDFDLFSNRSDKKSGNIFTTIGLMVISWAWVENTLAMTIGVISEYAGPIKGYKKLPLPMEQRIACLESALANMPALHKFKQSGDALVARFTELSHRRNDFMHGAALQLHDGSFESTSIAVKGGKSIFKNYRFTQDDAILLESEIAKLSDDATKFMVLICDFFQEEAT